MYRKLVYAITLTTPNNGMYVQMHIAIRSTSAHATLPVDWSKIYF